MATACHVRTLHKLSLIRQENWSKASPVVKQATVGSHLEVLAVYTDVSAAAGGFELADAIIERKTARIDDKGWAALTTEGAKSWNVSTRSRSTLPSASPRPAKTVPSTRA